MLPPKRVTQYEIMVNFAQGNESISCIWNSLAALTHLAYGPSADYFVCLSL